MNTNLIIAIIGLQITILGIMGKIAWDISNRFGMAEKAIGILSAQVEHLEKMIKSEADFETRARNRGYIK